ncbi:GNAT family N-acetyltransferase [Nocardia sp. MW-W600-9]
MTQVVDLFNEVGWHDEASIDADRLEQSFTRDAIVASAWCDDMPVGFVRAKIDGMYVILFNLVVHPAHQGQGLAGQLFDAICAAATSVPGIFGVIGHANRKGRSFYNRHGGLLYVDELEIIASRNDI